MWLHHWIWKVRLSRQYIPTQLLKPLIKSPRSHNIRLAPYRRNYWWPNNLRNAPYRYNVAANPQCSSALDWSWIHLFRFSTRSRATIILAFRGSMATSSAAQIPSAQTSSDERLTLWICFSSRKYALLGCRWVPCANLPFSSHLVQPSTFPVFSPLSSASAILLYSD